jgi:hypothetical protein
MSTTILSQTYPYGLAPRHILALRFANMIVPALGVFLMVMRVQITQERNAVGNLTARHSGKRLFVINKTLTLHIHLK